MKRVKTQRQNPGKNKIKGIDGRREGHKRDQEHEARGWEDNQEIGESLKKKKGKIMTFKVLSN